MTEDEARNWIETRWGADAGGALARYVEMLRVESDRQNLIARSTFATIWFRHIVDCAQLVTLAGEAVPGQRWLDIGSGAGLPGVVASILQPRSVLMVEPRRKRADFLQRVVDALTLDACVTIGKVETLPPHPSAIISARAVATLSDLLTRAVIHCEPETLWLLPKGQSALPELSEARNNWHGLFHVEHSLTAEDSLIVVARKVRRK